MRAVVVGGSIAGLGTALALSRAGHDVVVAEQDATPLPPDPVQAFFSWDRHGAPQVWHSHAFLARLRNLLRERAPDVLEALRAAGATEIRFGENLPPELQPYVPEPGDEDLVLLACRRITFEWALRRVVLELPHVRWRGGVTCTGLEAERDAATGLPRVIGVRVDAPGGAEVWPADVVADCTGRRSPLPAWLAAIGAGAPEEEREDCGIFYTSRFYRLREGAAPPPTAGALVATDLGYLKYAVFPGDSGIFSVTLAGAKDDAPLRRVMQPEVFDRALRQLPPVAAWVDAARAEPVTDVRSMAALANRRRRFVGADGEPLALAVHAVGESAVCQNPMYGRGCTLSVVHAYALADVLAGHGDDARAAALAFDAATRRELDPWYQAAVMSDRDARAVMRAQREGAGPAPGIEGPSDPGTPVDPQAFMRSVIQEGLFPAMTRDIVVLRAVVRTMNLLDTPDALMRNPDVIARVLAVWRDRAGREKRRQELGPPRERMLECLAAA